VFVRQVLQHLSNADITAVLERLQRCYKAAIITEAQPTQLTTPNVDIVSGNETRLPLGSGVYIDHPPHNLSVAEHLDTATTKQEVLRTSLIWFATPPRARQAYA
jgi:hypothetical protein